MARILQDYGVIHEAYQQDSEREHREICHGAELGHQGGGGRSQRG